MKVNFIPISLQDVEPYVYHAFNEDEELLHIYHISPGTLDHCVEHTMNFIKENAAFYGEDMKFYKLLFLGKSIGYTVFIKNASQPNELYSFGINIKFRKQDILINWLEGVKENIGNDYTVALWEKNSRAINFFKKNGFILEKEANYLGHNIKRLNSCRQVDSLLEAR
jgi:hypothetical protein